ncbi:MAG: TfuA-like protein, partial [Ruegeria sp.]
DWLITGKVDAKREDANEMLARMAEYLSDESPRAEEPQKMERTFVWKGLVRRIKAEAEAEKQTFENRDVLNELRLDPKFYSEVCDRAAFRMLAQSGRPPDTVNPDNELLRRQMALHRQKLGLSRHRDLIEWLQENDLDEAGYEDLLRGSHQMETVISENGTELETQILAELKWTGDYARLNERAKEKAKFFKDVQSSTASFAANDRLHVLMWYFETVLGTTMPEDVQAYARSLGLAEREEFCKLVEREFLFAQSTFGRAGVDNID